jgi:hypothetical protein
MRRDERQAALKTEPFGFFTMATLNIFSCLPCITSMLYRQESIRTCRREAAPCFSFPHLNHLRTVALDKMLFSTGLALTAAALLVVHQRAKTLQASIC